MCVRVRVCASMSCRACMPPAPRVPLLFAGASGGEASVHATCINVCWQDPGPARHQCLPFAPIVARRTCRWRGLSACNLFSFLSAGAAEGETSAQAACTNVCSQDLKAAGYRPTLRASQELPWWRRTAIWLSNKIAAAGQALMWRGGQQAKVATWRPPGRVEAAGSGQRAAAGGGFAAAWAAVLAGVPLSGAELVSAP